MYGATWRGGNSDGSRYVVDDSFSSVLKPEDTKNINWAASTNSEKNHFWYYVAAENGEIATVTPTEFQKEFDAAKQSPAAPRQRRKLPISKIGDYPNRPTVK